ncbi:carboxyphosphonoenolpyruvate phosphonomutase-like protein [Mycena crocata]|nr:carboxyphosphonoenolpyruvate phosphonomutase-like protein [Mycena crocata]
MSATSAAAPPFGESRVESSRALPATTQATLATHFASKHVSSFPILLANVWDLPSTHALLTHSRVQAVATASYAIVATHGVADEDLTIAQNLESVRKIAGVVVQSGKALSVDLQDGGEDLEGCMRSVIALGAVGGNLEDTRSWGDEKGNLYSVEEAVERIRTAKRIAAEMGVPDFVVNARTDVMAAGNGGRVEDAVARGKRYLEAGGKTVFVWGGTLVKELGGMVAVKMNVREGYLTVDDLRELGVARISVGPELFHKAMGAFRAGVDSVLGTE